jgi:hypothetical protein
MDITSWIFLKIHFITFKISLIIFYKNPTNNEKLEHMKYICDKVIPITKFEKIAYILQN